VSEHGSAKAWVLAFVLTAGVGLGAFIGIGCWVGANTCPGSATPRPTSTDGRTLYVEATCAGCHGINGQGDRGPSLVSGPLAGLSADELIAKIKKGKPLAGMPRFRDKLSEDQFAAIAQYIVTLRGGS